MGVHVPFFHRVRVKRPTFFLHDRRPRRRRKVFFFRSLSLFCCPPTDDDDDDDDDSSSTHPRLPQQSKSFLRLAILRLSFFRVCRKRILNSGGEGSKEYNGMVQKRRHKKEERERDG